MKLATILISLFFMNSEILQAQKTSFLPKLKKYLENIEQGFANIPPDRQESLQKIAAYISEKQKKGEKTEIIVICTHNSRRSHLGQVWLQIAASHYKLENITTFSGGTDSTACNPRTVKALQRAGLSVQNISEKAEKNPKYVAQFSKKAPEMWLFSKHYASTANPQLGFLALLVCDQADEACPIVKGADARLYHGYEDPKKSDGTPQESETYDQRCRQIATEMFYVMHQVKKSL